MHKSTYHLCLCIMIIILVLMSNAHVRSQRTKKNDEDNDMFLFNFGMIFDSNFKFQFQFTIMACRCSLRCRTSPIFMHRKSMRFDLVSISHCRAEISDSCLSPVDFSLFLSFHPSESIAMHMYVFGSDVFSLSYFLYYV